jgi:hypothetical protein
MFKSIHYLKSGNEKQRHALRAMTELGIFEDMAEYNPVLCGTVPIGIDVDGSDLDIVMEVHDFIRFSNTAVSLYQGFEGFACKEKILKSIPTIKVNFFFGGFQFELFGQPVPVEQQNAYRHMLVEHYLLTKYPKIKQDVIMLKKQGIKTEPAFARILGLEGDPYEELLLLEKNGLCER